MRTRSSGSGDRCVNPPNSTSLCVRRLRTGPPFPVSQPRLPASLPPFPPQAGSRAHPSPRWAPRWQRRVGAGGGQQTRGTFSRYCPAPLGAVFPPGLGGAFPGLCKSRGDCHLAVHGQGPGGKAQPRTRGLGDAVRCLLKTLASVWREGVVITHQAGDPQGHMEAMQPESVSSTARALPGPWLCGSWTGTWAHTCSHF